VINNGVAQIPLGVHVQAGPGLYLLWAAFAALFASVVPYMIRYDFCFGVLTRK
jgi:hypothetical protein